MASENDHIQEYLSHYIGLARSPQFAVLIRGAWGAGKSHIVRRVVGDVLKGSTKKYLYISLYGLQSAQEIDDALFQAAFPMMSWKGTKLVGRLGKAALKYLNFEPEIGVGDVLNKYDFDLFVFDDVERCEMPIGSVLGYINEFVEHNGCKVIIVAHEEEIAKGKQYRRRREKLVGTTLEVFPEFDEAYAHFVSELQDKELREFLGQSAASVASVFQQSQTSNLRILRQTLGEFERLYAALDREHKDDRTAMVVLLTMVFALSFELKSGRIAVSDLWKRPNLLYASVMKEEQGKKNDLLTASRRYPDVRLDADVMSDDTLVDFFSRGRVNAEKVRGDLNSSRYFLANLQEPPWRTVWHALDRTDDQFLIALSEFERQYANREFVVPGEMLHAFALRLWLSKHGFIEVTRPKIIKDAKKYIDELHKRGRLEAVPLYDHLDELRWGGWGNLGFHDEESPEFKELKAYLREKRRKARDETYPALAQVLLEEMSTNPSLFLRRVCVNNSGDSIYARVPLLAAMDPEDFVKALLALHPEHQRVALSALKERYDGFPSELAIEQPWVAQMRETILRRADEMQPLSQYRLKTLVKWYLDAAIRSGET